MSNRRDYGGGRDREFDRRERSPYRGSGRDDRGGQRPDDRGYGRDNGYRGNRDDRYQGNRDGGYQGERGGGRGGRGDRGGPGGRDRGGYGQSSGPPPTPKSNLPPLPASVPIPQAGNQLPKTMSSPQAKDGQAIQVLTNHYLIQSLPVIKIHEYELRFEFTAESKRGDHVVTMTPALIEKAAKAAFRVLAFGKVAVFNGTSLLWTPTELVEPGKESHQLINLPGHTAERPNTIIIYIRHVGSAKIKKIVDHFMSNRDIDIEAGMVWLNALFRHFPGAQDGWYARPKGLSFFIREQGLYMPLQSTGGVLEALRGLHQAVSTHWNCLTINVDIATTAFYTPDKSLRELAYTFAGLDPHSPPSALLHANLRSVSEMLSGIFFCVTHSGKERQKQKIKAKGLYQEQGRYTDAVQTIFTLTDRQTGNQMPISIQAYYESRYNLQLRYPTLPLVESRIGLFPLELCITAAGERYRSVLEGKETADFIKFATSPANVRAQQIEECVKRLAWHEQEVLSSQGVSVATKMLQVPAIKMRPPPVCYAQGSESTSINNGGWNLRNKVFVNPKALRSWGVVYLSKPSRNGQATEQEIEGFFRMMHGQLKTYGLSPPSGPPTIIIAQAGGDMKSVLNRLAEETCKQFRCNAPDMLFVLFHDGTSPSVYKSIKTIGEVEFGVPTQVMLIEKSLRGKGMQQYCANVCMKVNAKLGGVNSFVPLPGRLANCGLMIVGADVTHPTPAQLAMIPAPPSIAALTGTFDTNCCRYTAVSAPQQSTRESIATGASMPVFASMFNTLIDRFAERNSGNKPPKVVYFRDGVSDSQIAELKTGEIKLLREALSAHGGKLTAIVVQKRHHTRFFPVNGSNDRNGNVEPGTLVETGPNSTMAVAHGALQGTVRPSHYTIVENELGISKDEFHQLIMHGTHSYGKATRAVHTHSAIYYADIVAERSTARFRTSGDDTHFVAVNKKLEHTQWWL